MTIGQFSGPDSSIADFVRRVRATIDAQGRRTSDISVATMTTGTDGKPQFNLLNGKTCTGPKKGPLVLVNNRGGTMTLVADGRSKSLSSNGTVNAASVSVGPVGGYTPAPPPPPAPVTFIDNYGDKFAADGSFVAGGFTAHRATYEYVHVDGHWSEIDGPNTYFISPEARALYHNTTPLLADLTTELTGAFTPHDIDLADGWLKPGDASVGAADSFTGQCGFLGTVLAEVVSIANPLPAQVLDETTPDWDATTDCLLRLVGNRTVTCSTVSSGLKYLHVYNDSATDYTLSFGSGFATIDPLLVKAHERSRRYIAGTEVGASVRQPIGGGSAFPQASFVFMDAAAPVVAGNQILRIGADVTMTSPGGVGSSNFSIVNEDSGNHTLSFGTGFNAHAPLVIKGYGGPALWQIYFSGDPVTIDGAGNTGYLDHACLSGGVLLCAEFPIAYLDAPSGGRYWQGYIEDALVVRNATTGALLFAKSGTGTVLRDIYAANGFTTLGSGTYYNTDRVRTSMVHITADSSDGTWWVCIDASPVIGHVAYQGGVLVLLGTVTLDYAASPHSEGMGDGDGDDMGFGAAGRFVHAIYA